MGKESTNYSPKEPPGGGLEFLLYYAQRNPPIVGLVICLCLLRQNLEINARLKTGGVMKAVLPETVSTHLRLAGDFEPEVTRAMLQLLHPGDCLWNFGAHIGTRVVQAAATVGPNGIIYAFEPTDRTRMLLERNSDGRNTRVVIDPRALSDTLGSGEIYDYGWTHSGSNTVGRAAKLPDRHIKKVPKPIIQPISLETVDHLISSNSYRPPDGMVVDVEGYEEQAFTGALKTIRQYHPWIIFEVGPHPRTDPRGGIVPLARAGCVFFNLSPDGSISKHEPLGQYLQGANLLTIHPNKTWGLQLPK